MRPLPELARTLVALAALGPAPLLAQEPPAPDQGAFGAGRGLELTLDAAVRLAVENNIGLAIEGLNTEAFGYRERGSWGTFDWFFAAEGSVTDREFESTSVFSGSEENTLAGGLQLSRPNTLGGTFSARFDTVNSETDSTFNALATSTTDVVALTYTQPLLRGAWREYATSTQRQADLDWRQQREREREARLRLVFDTNNAYWDLVSAYEQLGVANSNLELARAQLDLDQRRLEAGVGIPLDVLQAETQVALREQDRLAAELVVRQADDALKQLIFPGTDGDVWDTEMRPATRLPEVDDALAVPPWSEAFAVAREERPELSAQRLAIDVARERHLRARSEKLPALDLDLSASATGFDGEAEGAFESAASYEFPTYRAALSYSVPFGNTSARYALKAAWTELRAALLVYDQLESQIVGEVREAVRQVHHQRLAVRAAQKSRDLAQRQYDAERARQREGTSTNFEVLQLQQDLAAARSTEATTRVEYAKALVSLAAAQGLLDAPADTGQPR